MYRLLGIVVFLLLPVGSEAGDSQRLSIADDAPLSAGCEDKQLKYKSAFYSVWSSEDVADIFAHVLVAKIPGVTPEVTFGEVFSTLASNGCRVWAWGGSVRDALLGRQAKDIDISPSCPVKRVAEIINEHHWQPLAINESNHHFKLGKAIDGAEYEYLEGKYFFVNMGASTYGLEYTTNALAYDLQSSLILDKTGYGVDDTCNKVIRIPTPQGQQTVANFEIWDQGNGIFGDDPVRKLRGWKLKGLKGYEWAVKATEGDISVEDYLIKTTLTKTRFPALEFKHQLCKFSGGQFDKGKAVCHGNYECVKATACFFAITDSLDKVNGKKGDKFISKDYLRDLTIDTLPQCGGVAVANKSH